MRRQRTKRGAWSLYAAVWTALAAASAFAGLGTDRKGDLPIRGVRHGAVTVHVTPDRPLNTFKPSQALGAGVDGHECGSVAGIYAPANVDLMKSAGFGPLSYRLRTELAVEAWHWNPQGAWSDPANRQGYWTSSAIPAANGPGIRKSNGYRLPRRGNTFDQANDDGYSRLDDGDPETFWKSNPYLDRHFTGEPNTRHPQWVVLDLGEERPVDALRIRWGVPYATHYRVEYWTGEDEAMTPEMGSHGQWETFDDGEVDEGTGGDTTLRVSDEPQEARFIRILMTESSGQPPAGSRDLRDGLGFAIREIGVGTLTGAAFHDLVRHAPQRHEQSATYASSTDPWHRADDLDPDTEQPGLDLVFSSGLTNGQPLLVPVPVVYDTPENAAAEVQYLLARGYPVRKLEMGEEADGQYMAPEDYAALYLQWADALRLVDSRLKFGGPALQSAFPDWTTWPNAAGNRSWVNRFVSALERRGRRGDLSFFSFEWYPFDDANASPGPQLAAHPAMLSSLMQRLEADGLSHDIPWLITEYGYSPVDTGRTDVDLPGGMLLDEIVSQFLSLKGSGTFLLGLEPSGLERSAAGGSWGGNGSLFVSSAGYHVRCHGAGYFALQMLNRHWAEPGNRIHAVYPAESDIRNTLGQDLVSTYAAHRPDGQWALLLLNKQHHRAASVQVRFAGATPAGAGYLQGRADLYQYSAAQFAWHEDGAAGTALRDLPPSHTRVEAGSGRSILLPPFSISVLRGTVR